MWTAKVVSTSKGNRVTLSLITICFFENTTLYTEAKPLLPLLTKAPLLEGSDLYLGFECMYRTGLTCFKFLYKQVGFGKNGTLVLEWNMGKYSYTCEEIRQNWDHTRVPQELLVANNKLYKLQINKRYQISIHFVWHE